MPSGFIYVVDRDFGFAPNPFHGTCTLATCKPQIRSVAKTGDWIVGMGGSRLRSTGRCIFAMEVSEKITFEEYWNNSDFRNKKPVRNGSKRMLVGDNIYHKEGETWIQEDSHHSLEGGLPNPLNITKDTKVNSVLVSRNFHYFGRDAIDIDSEILSNLGYKNRVGHRRFELSQLSELLKVITSTPKNQVLADPFDFTVAASRYSGVSSRITR